MAQKKSKKSKKRAAGMMMTDAMKDAYARLFMDALDQMEAAEWTKPWVAAGVGRPANLYRQQRPYTKSNAFFLDMLCQLKGYGTALFVTKTQMQDEKLKYSGLTANRTIVTGEDGCPVFDDKGWPVFDVEKRFPVVFFKPYYRDADGNRLTEEEYDEMTADEQAECKVRWVQQWYRVYNLDQTDFAMLYPDAYKELTKVPEHEYTPGQRDEVLERMIVGGEWRCKIEFGGAKAYYRPSADVVRLPERRSFFSDEAFYSTALHEMAHSTAPELKRTQEGGFGSEDYALEEFIAELTAAIVCSQLGVGKLLDRQHIAYVQNWRKALREDKDFIPRVIDHVQRAVNFIIGRYRQVEKAMEGETLAIAA